MLCFACVGFVLGQGLKPRFTVAVIDSGVDYEHPDLQNQIWRNPDEICGNGIDDDFNGFVDDCIGWVCWIILLQWGFPI